VIENAGQLTGIFFAVCLVCRSGYVCVEVLRANGWRMHSKIAFFQRGCFMMVRRVFLSFTMQPLRQKFRCA
jgi:hypothetical protein